MQGKSIVDLLPYTSTFKHSCIHYHRAIVRDWGVSGSW
jgi:hypothetical protein